MLDANKTVAWTPPQYKKRMDDWLRNMSDWNISRKRYFGLPLPFYPCSCGHLNVIGSRAELEERAVAGLEQLEELHRPWIDAVRIRCEACDATGRAHPRGRRRLARRRHRPLLDARLEEPGVDRSTGTRPAPARALGADLPDHAYWEKWFPADWVSEMREQIRLWFYSQCFMSVDAHRPLAVPARAHATRRCFDEHGKAMHKSTGNAIEPNEALERMGADVMRWLYCAQTPSEPLKFGFGLADDVKRRVPHVLELGEVLRRVREHRGLPAVVVGAQPRGRPRAARPLARRADARVRARRRGRIRGVRHGQRHARVRGVRRRSLQLVHPPVAPALLGGGDAAAFQTLWYALVQTLRVMAPIMPFVTDHLWRNLVPGRARVRPSRRLARGCEPDRALLDEIADVRRVVALAHQARSSAACAPSAVAQARRRRRAAAATPPRSPTR